MRKKTSSPSITRLTRLLITADANLTIPHLNNPLCRSNLIRSRSNFKLQVQCDNQLVTKPTTNTDRPPARPRSLPAIANTWTLRRARRRPARLNFAEPRSVGDENAVFAPTCENLPSPCIFAWREIAARDALELQPGRISERDERIGGESPQRRSL
ncbi:hypothetical protein BKA80DRAFT_46794 [Phyllosticta citrichinensis]